MARDSVPVLVFKRTPARQVTTTEVLAYLRDHPFRAPIEQDGTGGHPFPVQVDALLGGGVPDVVPRDLPVAVVERVAFPGRLAQPPLVLPAGLAVEPR